MWYHFTLTVPAATTETSPVERSLKLTHGIITYIGIGFPSGCYQLVKAKVYHQEHQIFPQNLDEPAAWEGGIEGGQHHYRLLTPPYLLKAKAYSPAATLSHNITIFINLLPVEIAEPWRAQMNILDRVKTVLGLK